MLTQKNLKDCLYYDPETGVFFHCVRADRTIWWNKKHGNKEAGCVSDHSRKGGYPIPYVRINLEGKSYHAHRLAWLYMTGKWPQHEVDHVDGDGINNRWANLREATKTQNAWNTKAHSNNTSGFKGVSWDRERQKWTAHITVNGHQRALGRFDAIEGACAAYDAEVAKHHGEFAAAPERRVKETA